MKRKRKRKKQGRGKKESEATTGHLLGGFAWRPPPSSVVLEYSPEEVAQ